MCPSSFILQLTRCLNPAINMRREVMTVHSLTNFARKLSSFHMRCDDVGSRDQLIEQHVRSTVVLLPLFPFCRSLDSRWVTHSAIGYQQAARSGHGVGHTRCFVVFSFWHSQLVYFLIQYYFCISRSVCLITFGAFILPVLLSFSRHISFQFALNEFPGFRGCCWKLFEKLRLLTTHIRSFCLSQC